KSGRSWVPLAQAIGDRRLHHHSGYRCRRKDHSILRQPHTAPDTAGTEYHRGDRRRETSTGSFARCVDEAFSCGVEQATEVASVRILRHAPPQVSGNSTLRKLSSVKLLLRIVHDKY